MTRLRFTSAAFQDLEQIILYIASRNPTAAGHLAGRLENECIRLAENPGLGQPRSDLANGLRFFPVGSYLIFYREASEGIEVIRVLHGARDYRDYF